MSLAPERTDPVVREIPSGDYLALMTCHAKDGWLRDAEHQLAAWLRWKGIGDPDTSSDFEWSDGSRDLSIRHHHDAHSRSIQARVVERDTLEGTWTTNFLAHDRDGEGDWISLNVISDKGRFVNVPRLARYLMQALPLGDGSLEFVDNAQVFHEARTDELLDLLCDADRHGLVLVAGTTEHDGIDLSRYVDQVNKWTRQVYGLAQVLVLDPAATRALSDHVGVHHAVPPWTIRSFLPGLDPASEVDGRRHRILGTSRLAEMSEGQVRSLLGRAARRHARQRIDPVAVLRVQRTFQRLENADLVSAIRNAEPSAPAVEAPSETEILGTADEDATTPAFVTVDTLPAMQPDVAAETERFQAQIVLVKTILGLREIDEGALRAIASRSALPDPGLTQLLERAQARLSGLQVQIEEAEDRARFYRELYEEEELVHEIADEDNGRLADENRYLRKRLWAAEDHEAAFASVPESAVTSYPASLAELFDRAAELEPVGVTLTADRKTAERLDEVDTLGKFARQAWEVCLVLADYVRSRNEGAHDRGVDGYLRNTPLGFRSLPVKRHAAGETESTMNGWGDQRWFPVPVDVDPSGHRTMEAHFKLAQSAMVSPRLYYLDDWATSRRVIVGYIGPHLTNTQTN